VITVTDPVIAGPQNQRPGHSPPACWNLRQRFIPRDRWLQHSQDRQHGPVQLRWFRASRRDTCAHM